MRKQPEYLCTECRHEFDEAVYKTVDELISIFYENEDAMEVRDKCFITMDNYGNKYNLSNIKYWLQKERVKVQDKETIERKAFLLYLDDNIKYLSFEDTITACRTCALNFDLHHLELCPKCSCREM